MIQWHSKENPYQSNVFKKARIPKDELNMKKLRVRIRAACLESSLAEKVLKPNLRFEEELFAHAEHKVDTSSLNEYIQDYGKLPISLDDLKTDNISIKDPAGFIELPKAGSNPIPKPVSFQLPALSMEEDADVGINLDK
jgi:hypothetical protein